jgi:hypothetical protein
MCLMHNLTNAFVLYYIFTQNDEIGTNYNNIYKINLSYEFQIMLIIMCILNCFALMFLFNLIIFHIELKYRGLTTYEFLKMKENLVGKESKIILRVTQ